MGESMKELLEITEQDIREVAEKMGWEYDQSEAGIGVIGPTNGFAFIGGMSDDYNAAAILAIEKRLIAAHIDLSIYRFNREPIVRGVAEFSNDQTCVDVDMEKFMSPNFRTWLIVQIVKALPKSVFEVKE